jgi:hypothetical protein
MIQESKRALEMTRKFKEVANMECMEMSEVVVCGAVVKYKTFAKVRWIRMLSGQHNGRRILKRWSR